MKLRVRVNGVDYEVEVEILEDVGGAAAPPPRPAAPVATPMPPRPPVAPVAPAASAPAPAAAPAAGGKTLNSPIPGTVVEVKVSPGQTVSQDETVLVIDAMKMNTPVAAPHAGKVKEVLVKQGDPVKMGQPLVTFE